MKRRVASMAARLKELDRDGLWIEGPDPETPLLVKPDQWTTTVHKLATVYTDFTAIVAGYGSVRVGPDAAYRVWDKEHPAPNLEPGDVGRRGAEKAGVLLARSNRSAEPALNRMVARRV